MKTSQLWPLLLLPVAACAPGSRNDACKPLTQAAAAPRDNTPFHGTVFTIVMENQSASDILGASGPPYINQLARDYAVAGSYSDPSIHPSEPNYLWMVAGENFGVTTDADPAENHVACSSHIVDQMERVGISWHAYVESMGQPCDTVSHYPYAAKHNPFVYFDDLNGWDGRQFTRPARCTDNVVDFSQLDADLAAGKLPKYVFITPNMVDDMHDGSVADGDRWLSQEVPKILASKAFTDGGVLFLTWDEGGGLSGNDHPPMIVISPLAKKGYVSSAPYDTSSYLKTVQTLLGVEALPCDPAGDGVATMDDLFAVPLPK